MKSKSTINPLPITMVRVINGVATLICAWDIVMDVIVGHGCIEDIISWDYEAATIKWSLPIEFDGIPITADNIYDYLNVNEAEIMSYAKGTKLNW